MIMREKLEQRYDHARSWTTKDGKLHGHELKGSNIKRKDDGSKFLDKSKEHKSSY